MGSVGQSILNVGSDFVSTITGGIVDPKKGRFNVPGTSAQMRTLAKGYANVFTGGKYRNDINAGLDSKPARIAGTVAGVAAGVAAGAGAASAVGGAGAGAAAGAGTGAAAPAAAGTTLGLTASDAAVGALGLTAAAQAVPLLTKKSSPPPPSIASSIKNTLATDAERERLARVAAANRRRDYRNVGRSSTILTSPVGLTGSAPGQQKTLLGY